jgi:hypothetical protein
MMSPRKASTNEEPVQARDKPAIQNMEEASPAVSLDTAAADEPETAVEHPTVEPEPAGVLKAAVADEPAGSAAQLEQPEPESPSSADETPAAAAETQNWFEIVKNFFAQLVERWTHRADATPEAETTDADADSVIALEIEADAESAETTDADADSVIAQEVEAEGGTSVEGK